MEPDGVPRPGDLAGEGQADLLLESPDAGAEEAVDGSLPGQMAEFEDAEEFVDGGEPASCPGSRRAGRLRGVEGVADLPAGSCEGSALPIGRLVGPRPRLRALVGHLATGYAARGRQDHGAGRSVRAGPGLQPKLAGRGD